jgi:hypothetical protein
MPDFNVRSDSVNVEHIMEQLRTRIREKRGVDYTEEQIRELAAVKLERFLDPRGVRSDLLDQFRKAMPAYEPPVLPNYSFESDTLFESHRGVIRFFRKLFHPLLKLFLFNPNPLIKALNIQAQLNTMYSEREAARESSRRAMDQLYYELIHNLVVELTRTGIEVKNLKMRVESLAGRLEFNERRARALESAVVYKPSSDERAAQPPQQPPPPAPAPAQIQQAQAPQPTATPSAQIVPAPGGAPGEGPGQRSRRRRRRRGRRGGGAVAGQFGSASGTPQPSAGSAGSAFAAPTADAASAFAAADSQAASGGQAADEGSGGTSESEDLGHLADDGGPAESDSDSDPDAQ